MAKTKPVFVFCPGAWHSPECFDLVRADLHKNGWETEAVAYPSVGAEPPNKHLSDDAAAVRALLEQLVGQGKEIVLVVHSYGGLVGADAVKGLGFKQRASEGKSGGVILFVYMTAFVTPLGKSILEMLGGQKLPWMNYNGDCVHPDTPEQIFYHDVESGLQKKSVAALKHTCAAVFTEGVTHEPWHDVPCAYLICEEDKALFPVIQEQMAAALGPDSLTLRLKASHSPFLSKVAEIVEALEQVTKTIQERS